MVVNQIAIGAVGEDDVVDGDPGLHDGGVEIVVGQWTGGGYVAVAEVRVGFCVGVALGVF